MVCKWSKVSISKHKLSIKQNFDGGTKLNLPAGKAGLTTKPPLLSR